MTKKLYSLPRPQDSINHFEETEWKAQKNLVPLAGRNSGIEFQDDEGEYHYFEILMNSTHLAFGGFCNAGFLESGNIRREEGETIDETLTELFQELETYYNDGPQFVTRITFNDRM